MSRTTIAVIFALSAAGFTYHSMSAYDAQLQKYLAEYCSGPAVECDGKVYWLGFRR